MMLEKNIGKLAAALAKFQGSIGAIPKNKEVKVSTRDGRSYNFKYADLSGIWDAIQKPLSENELSVSQPIVEENDKEYLLTILLHSSGEMLVSKKKLRDYEKLQEYGSQLTYLKRYQLSCILGISCDEDDDANAADDNDFEAKDLPKKSYTPPAPCAPTAEAIISKEELKTMKDLIKKMGNPEHMETFVCKTAKVISLDKFPKYKFKDAVEYLQKQLGGVQHAGAA